MQAFDLDLWALKHNVSAVALAELRAMNLPAPGSMPLEDGASESRVQSQIRLASPQIGALWRNNAGGFQDDTGRMIRYGLGNESSRLWKKWRSGDLVGISKIVIQPHHIGRTFGVFTMIEVKEADWTPAKLKQASNDRERAQLNCLTHVSSLGGIAGFAKSVADYENYVTQWSAYRVSI